MWVLFFQGVYYAVTGLWSLLHVASFEAVTGPKTDVWLVHTVGTLVFVIGLVFLIVIIMAWGIQWRKCDPTQAITAK